MNRSKPRHSRTLRRPGIRHRHLPYHTIPFRTDVCCNSQKTFIALDQYHTIPMCGCPCSFMLVRLHRPLPYHTIPYHTIPYHANKVYHGCGCGTCLTVFVSHVTRVGLKRFRRGVRKVQVARGAPCGNHSLVGVERLDERNVRDCMHVAVAQAVWCIDSG